MDFVSVFGISFDPWLAAALVSGLGALAISAILLVAVLLLRWRTYREEAACARVRERWWPRFAAAAMGDAAEAERPGAAEMRAVLETWNQHAASFKGPALKRLAEYARRCGLAECAARLLARRNTRDRLLALITFGHLGERGQFAAVRAAAGDPNHAVSLAAARALLRIDPARGLAALLAPILERTDWPVARLADALSERPQRAAEDLLALVLGRAREQDLPRLLALARVIAPGRIAPTVHAILERSTDPETLIAALKRIADPRSARLVRARLAHPDWRVRVAAIQALGRIATEKDLHHLVGALSDREWWVRQRAADALARLPFASAAQLERLRAAVNDRYGKDALARAIAEKSVR